jgi:CSLREA domain-containing protein
VRLRFVMALVAVGLVVWGGVGGAMSAAAGSVRVGGMAAWRVRARGGVGRSGLPAAARGPVSEVLGGGDPAFRVVGLRAFNSSQQLGLRFSRAGVVVSAGGGRVRLALVGLGYASTVRPVGSVRPSAEGNRVMYVHPGVREWYVNGPLGVEQGFDVLARPRAAAGPLTLSVALAGNMRARLERGGVVLAGGGATLRYGDLSVTDARGRVLPARLALASGRVLIRIEDRGARYPLRVDPFTEQQKIVPGDASGSEANPGSSVAVSASGSTMLIGGSFDGDADPGAAWVFVRSGSSWQEQAKLVPTDAGPYGFPEFGTSVALSADGNTAVIGAPDDNTLGAYGQGAVWVYVRSGSTWTEQQKIVPADARANTGLDGVGGAVAVSADGNTVLFDGPTDYAGWVYTRSGSTWTEQQELDFGTYTVPSSVALSGDGTTAIIGTALVAQNGGSSDKGAAWIYALSGSSWSLQQELMPGDESGYSSFGSSVSLSSTGDAAVIGGSGDGNGVGAAWIYTRSGTSWSEEKKLVPADEGSTSDDFGASASMSADGHTVLLGGTDYTGTDQGAAWVYTSSGSTWTEQQKISPADAGATTQIGYSVALSSYASTAVIGAPDDEHGDAAVWAYTAPALVVNSTGDQDDTATDLSSGVCNVNLTGPQACTLRAAIQVAAQQGGGTITFDIPSGPSSGNVFDGSVPQIDTQGFTVSNPITIDGSTQPGAGMVELTASNTNAGIGIDGGGDGTILRGLVLNRFAQAITVDDAGDITIQDDRIGTDPSGEQALPPNTNVEPTFGIDLNDSSNDQIGGTGAGQGNVISGNIGVGIVLGTTEVGGSPSSCSGIKVQGNTIGPALGQQTLLLPSPPPTDIDQEQQTAIFSECTGDMIGGSTSAAGNMIAGNVALWGEGEVIQGNTLTAASLDPSGPNATIGGPTATPGSPPGNTFHGACLTVSSSDATVEGNAFQTGESNACTRAGIPDEAILLRDAEHATIGGPAPDLGNLIDGGGELQPPVAPWGFGVATYSTDAGAEGNVIEDNTIRGNSIAGVGVLKGAGNEITDNAMSANGGGIDFGTSYAYDSLSPRFSTGGPNDLEPYPLLLDNHERGGHTDVTIAFDPPHSGDYRIELYQQPECSVDSVTPGQGAKSLGTQTIKVSVVSTRTLTFNGAAGAITATATSPNGSTSEFSPCLTIGRAAPTFLKRGVTPTERRITFTTQNSSDPALIARTGKKLSRRAHGTLDLLCPPITTRYCQGSYTLMITSTHIERIIRGHFKLARGQVKAITVTLTGKLLSDLLSHRLHAKITINAHDGAKHPHHKHTLRKLRLVYKRA